MDMSSFHLESGIGKMCNDILWSCVIQHVSNIDTVTVRKRLPNVVESPHGPRPGAWFSLILNSDDVVSWIIFCEPLIGFSRLFSLLSPVGRRMNRVASHQRVDFSLSMSKLPIDFRSNVRRKTSGSFHRALKTLKGDKEEVHANSANSLRAADSEIGLGH
jgi:hypothetical protein